MSQRLLHLLLLAALLFSFSAPRSHAQEAPVINPEGSARLAVAPNAEIAAVLASATGVAAGSGHTCAVTAAGGVLCWGNNDYGQLGNGTSISSSTPQPVNGLASGVAALAAGDWHTCALTNAGGVQCWGRNQRGQLGDGTVFDRSTPVSVYGLGAAMVAAGGEHTCAVTAGGALLCWGYNVFGQIGDGTTTRRRTPVAVSGLASGVAFVATGYRHTCAVTDAAHGGEVLCWGWNVFGQLGDGSQTERHTPVAVTGLLAGGGAAAVATGADHSCAVTGDGAVLCWGFNAYGQLGDGTQADRSTPGAVSGLASGVASVTAGGGHTCALMDAAHGGGVLCWGRDDEGQLGDGTRTNRSLPGAASGLPAGEGAVTAIAAGQHHTCAVLGAGHGGGLRCWGWNTSGQLGNGTTTNRSTPVVVGGLPIGGGAVAAIATGDLHSCAVIDAAGGGARCWGSNAYGRLGDGTTTDRFAPVAVSGLPAGVAAVTAGVDHSCALTAGERSGAGGTTPSASSATARRPTAARR